LLPAATVVEGGVAIVEGRIANQPPSPASPTTATAPTTIAVERRLVVRDASAAVAPEPEAPGLSRLAMPGRSTPLASRAGTPLLAAGAAVRGEANALGASWFPS
jgi:hypothetical protein